MNGIDLFIRENKHHPTIDQFIDHVDRVEILPFHKMGENKYETSGKEYQLADTDTPDEEDMERARAIFARHGITAF